MLECLREGPQLLPSTHFDIRLATDTNLDRPRQQYRRCCLAIVTRVKQRRHVTKHKQKLNGLHPQPPQLLLGDDHSRAALTSFESILRYHILSISYTHASKTQVLQPQTRQASPQTPRTHNRSL